MRKWTLLQLSYSKLLFCLLYDSCFIWWVIQYAYYSLFRYVVNPATTFPAHKKRWQMALGRPYLLKGGFKTTIQKVDWWREFNLLWATIPPEETTIKNLSSAGNLSWRLPYPQIKRLYFSFVFPSRFDDLKNGWQMCYMHYRFIGRAQKVPCFVCKRLMHRLCISGK